MDQINNWENMTEKIKQLNHDRDELHKKLKKIKSFEKYMEICKSISRINYHLEVIYNLTKYNSSERDRVKSLNSIYFNRKSSHAINS